MEDGRWKMEDGRWKMENKNTLVPRNRLRVHNKKKPLDESSGISHFFIRAKRITEQQQCQQQQCQQQQQQCPQLQWCQQRQWFQP